MTRSRYKGSKEEAESLNVYVKLMRAAESVSARVHGSLSEAGLTISQFGVLEALHHLGPLSQAEIAKKILKSTGNITMVIDNLEKRGLVKRERDQEDRRYYSISLTSEGKRVISELFPQHAVRITREMSILSAAEQVTLGRLCRKLGLGTMQTGKGYRDE